jgi:hypothetical protein
MRDISDGPMPLPHPQRIHARHTVRLDQRPHMLAVTSRGPRRHNWIGSAQPSLRGMGFALPAYSKPSPNLRSPRSDEIRLAAACIHSKHAAALSTAHDENHVSYRPSIHPSTA